MNTTSAKQNSAKAALEIIKSGQVIGIGSGTTVSVLVQAIALKLQSQGVIRYCLNPGLL